MEKTFFRGNNMFLCRPVCTKHTSSLCWKEHSKDQSLIDFFIDLVNDGDYKKIFKDDEKLFDLEYLAQQFRNENFDGQVLFTKNEKE